jgi:3-methyladenine DNA glycosylase/8-oxoguanine DNA glycosylase
MNADTILAEISPGELIDKITILEIKCERLDDPAKLENVRYALDRLQATRGAALPHEDELASLEAELKEVNGRLWDIEDEIRDCERQGDFGQAFVALARQVYRQNDRRAALKKAIDRLYGSAMTEEKSYRAY